MSVLFPKWHIILTSTTNPQNGLELSGNAYEEARLSFKDCVQKK